MRTFFYATLLSALTVSAQAALSGGIGDLLVTPTRVALDRRTHTAEIALINTGSAPATYRIEIQHMRMNANGDLATVNEPATAFADALVQFSPRRVVLQPHITQTVRLLFRPPAKSTDSELYLHLLFRAEPPEEPASETLDGKSLTIKLTPIYGVAIPVLVRLDNTEATVHIDAVHLAAESAIAFTVERSGNRSTYGNIAVTFTPRGGRVREVAVVKGVSVYVPLAARFMTLPLHLPDGVALRDGSLQVSYVDAERNGAPATSATLALP
jgi:P pilus assembly chaperone PapD